MSDTSTVFVPPYKHEGETKTKYAERTEWLRKLWTILKPGDTITTVLRHVSASGMYRAIDMYLIRCEDGKVDRSWLSYWAAHAGVGGRWDNKREAVGVSGVGMDMGFHLVYELSYMLYPNGFDCVDTGEHSPIRGQSCPANDHFNAWNADRHGRCFMCGAELGEITYTRDQKRVCSQACASGVWHHNDGGYALRQEWL